MNALETKQLTKTYISGHFWSKKSSPALNGIDLKIKNKQVFGLLGLNGAGKTTLLKILIGLLLPSFGKAVILGKPAGDIQTRKEIAYLPEMPYFPRYLTPLEILDFYGKLYELPVVERKKKTLEALVKVGLYEKRTHKLKEFSKGMLQKVGIAQLLLNNAKIYFLDEPTYGLDPLAAKQMRDIILELKKAGKTIFLNTHQINEVNQICDRIGILNNGHLIEDIEVKNIKGSMESFFVKRVQNNGKA
ncbi:MAG: ABC transporter ATP-binding protein [Candidatus Firestonebacteria bacterium]|nr:ABC transporter ATP-binding protein [Candidatus Firestonebacteria bacterium]